MKSDLFDRLSKGLFRPLTSQRQRLYSKGPPRPYFHRALADLSMRRILQGAAAEIGQALIEVPGFYAASGYDRAQVRGQWARENA
jgi:hypothetical protein